MSYSSLDEILRDRRLGFTAESNEPVEILHAIQTRMKDLGDQQTGVEYGLLCMARDWIVSHIDEQESSSGAALVPIAASTLDKLVDIISAKSATRYDEGGASVPSETKLVTHANIAVEKASTDFRRARVLPFAGFGTFIASFFTVLGRANLGPKTVSASIWYMIAALAVLAAICLFMLAHRNGQIDERALRLLYDPDIHGEVINILIDGPEAHGSLRIDRRLELVHEHDKRDGLTQFTRTQFRELLWDIADGRLPSSGHLPIRPNISSLVIRGRYVSEPHSRLLSTVDLASAAIDATGLALDRLTRMNILEATTLGGLELFTIRDSPNDSAYVT